MTPLVSRRGEPIPMAAAASTMPATMCWAEEGGGQSPESEQGERVSLAALDCWRRREGVF